MKTIIEILSFVIIPLCGPGIVRKTRARAQGRKGPPFLQPWYDLRRAIQKDPIDGTHSGFFTEVSPLFAIVGGLGMWFTMSFDFVPILFFPFFIVIQTLALTSFAMETGTSFGGLGTSREMILGIMAKPAILILAMLMQAGARIPEGDAGYPLTIALGLVMTVIALAEAAKPPFDDPRTHLELTMVHEAMLLEASGRRFAFLEIGSLLKEASVFLFIPRTLANLNGRDDLWMTPICGLLIFFALGYWESISVRRKWSLNSENLGLVLMIVVFVAGIIVAGGLSG